MTDLARQLKIYKANEAVDKMKAWFKSTRLPERVELDCQKIENVKLYVDTALNTIDHSPVLSQHFRAAYIRLYSLKQHLEKK